MLVNCRSCRTEVQVPARTKWIRCALCKAITKIGGFGAVPRREVKGSINEAKKRQLAVILNKLRAQNFVKQVKDVNIDSAVTLRGFVSQFYDRALMEPRFCEMFAKNCSNLNAVLPEFSEDNEKITFKGLLLKKCQEEFEREANRVEVECSEEEREEKRIQARRRMLGNIKLIGELYKKKMLRERIIHYCIKELLGQNQTPDEEDIESLCKLMSTIGVMIDSSKAKERMDTYFDIMTKFSNDNKLSSRVRFMLKDSIDLRNNKWQHRKKVKGWKMRASDRSLDRSMASSSAPVQPTSIAHSGTVSATVSTSTSSSAASPSEESASVTGTEGKQKETVRRIETFKDGQKKTGRKDAKNTQLLNQGDVSNHAGSVKLSSPRMSRDVTRGFDYVSGPDVSVSSVTPHQDSYPESNAISDVILKHEKSAEIIGGSLVPVPGSKDRPTSETNSAKNMKGKGKKKRKDILKAADAAGSTFDLYMAYKGPEEKLENAVPGESIESSCSILLREALAQTPTVETEKDIITAKEDGQIKGEPDDWEDAAELSTPKLKTFVGKQGRAGSAGNNEDGNIGKKYSRDFLLTLSEQCTDLPTGFEIESDIAESLMHVQVGISHIVEREMYPYTGRNTDRTRGGPRPDRKRGKRASWSK